MTEPRVSVAFGKLADLCIALGQHPLNKHAGCWEHQVDERWWVCINGHPEPRKNSDGFEVPQFDCVVKYNGWPAGMFGPYGGIIAAGDCANEETFIEALEAATKRASEGKSDV